MSANLETVVHAQPPVLVPAGKGAVAPPRAPTAARELERAQEARDHDERVARWKGIAEAGGIDAWLAKELGAKGHGSDHVDPGKLTDAEKGNYKTRKKAEAEAKRALKKLAWQAYHTTHISHLGVGIHWDDTAGPDRFDTEDREARARGNELPAIATAEQLAEALGLSMSKLRWLAFHRAVDTGSHYRRWTVPKRDGTPRTITAPKKTLKAVQRWALRNVAEKLPVHGAAHGFVAQRSIVTNAVAHAGADVLVKMDVKDFFPTVTWRRVKGLFRKAGLNEQVATLLALLATEAPRELVQFRGKTLFVASGPRALPQGAPTSPAITNAICMRLDRRMSGLARLLGFVYTRYADDLAFSWRAPAVKAAKGAPVARAPVGALLRGAKQILAAEGFVAHPDKTSVLRRGERQKITGLVVNRAGEGIAPARVPRATLRKLRAAIHNRAQGKPGQPGESLAQLRGMAAFVHMTDAARGRALLAQLDALEAREGDATAS